MFSCSNTSSPTLSLKSSFTPKHKDEEQVRDHYDRGNDFYAWFLGPRMVYTSGLITDMTKMETLEQLQDNKMTMVCEKLGLRKGDRMLDIGCGWGTLATHAAKNYEADVTGVNSIPASLRLSGACADYNQSLSPGTKPLLAIKDCVRTEFPSHKAAFFAWISETYLTRKITSTRSHVLRWPNTLGSGDMALSSEMCTTC